MRQEREDHLLAGRGEAVEPGRADEAQQLERKENQSSTVKAEEGSLVHVTATPSIIHDVVIIIATKYHV